MADSIPLPRPASFNEDDVSDKPQHVQEMAPMSPSHISCTERIWQDRLESMKSVDVLLGALGSAVRSKGVLADTVFIFTSDNGYLHGEHRLHKKVFPYEEAIRVPLYVRYPTSPIARPQTYATVNTDLAPTIAALAGVTPGLPVDGRSLVPLLEGQPPPVWRKRFLLEHWFAEGTPHVPTYFGIRTVDADPETPNVAYVEYEDAERSREYYLLPDDPGQLMNSHEPSQVPPSLVQFLLALKACGNGTCQSLEDSVGGTR